MLKCGSTTRVKPNMTATGHAVIGTVIAASIPNPLIAIPLALASHIVADLFPHWDIGTHRKNKPKSEFIAGAVIDVIASYTLTILMVFFLFPETDLIYAFIVVFAAQFFDWASAPYYVLNIENPPIFKWFYKFQKKFDNRLDKPWGIIGQVVALVGLVLLVLVI